MKRVLKSKVMAKIQKEFLQDLPLCRSSDHFFFIKGRIFLTLSYIVGFYPPLFRIKREYWPPRFGAKKEYWPPLCCVCVILFSCVCGHVRFDNCVWQSQIPSCFVSCALGAFLGGSQGGARISPPWLHREFGSGQ